MKTWRTGLWALAAVGIWASSVQAKMATRRWGEAPKAGPAAKAAVPRAKPPTTYVVETKTPPQLDGQLDDAAWKQAAPLHLGRTLSGGGAAAVATEVRLLRDGKALYLAVRAFEPMIGKLQASRRGHDGAVWSDDGVEIFIGTGGVYYHFGVNAVGSTYDARVKDGAWNAGAGFKTAAGRGQAEWTLEIAIPLKPILRGGGKIPTNWIANFNRNRQVTGSLQEFSWSPTYSGDSHVPGRFGRMLFKPPPAQTVKPVRPVVKKKAMEILPAEGAEGIVRFDLSDLPKRAKIYRADLLVFRTTKVDGRMDQAMKDIVVVPLLDKPGPRARAGETLALRGPWFDRFDATEAVKAWAAGQTNGGFLVKQCPFFRAEATCLDVAYDADPPKDLPKQASGVRAVHRAGQTFITFKEIADPLGADAVSWRQMKSALANLDRNGRIRYCIYRHTKRITTDNLHQAELIARVKPLSGWNVNARNIDRPIDQYIATADGLMVGHWNPFNVARVDDNYGLDCPIERFVIADGSDPLRRGTGLYVHTPGQAGKAYYAVVTALNGVENTRDITSSNAPAAAVTESAGAGEPVCQGELPKMPFFNYAQKRLQYVRWVAPPQVNVPSQYYNWSVGVPEPLGKAVPLELNLHRDGHSFWRTHYRIERNSIVICPYDFPVKSWWYGYHESLGTLKSFKSGAIQPYTERRLLAFIDWAAKQWPVDRNRVLVTGCRGGASGGGALHLGLRHPDVFNVAISGHGMLEYSGPAQGSGRRGAATALSMQAVWGRVEWQLKTDDGKPFWPQMDMVRLVKDLPASTDLPLVTLSASGRSAHTLYEAMLAKHHAVMGEFAWGGSRYIPVSATGTYPNVIRLDVAKDRPLLAFIPPADAKARYGGNQLNREFRWRDAVDRADRFEATLFTAGRGGSVASVAVRRLKQFKVAKGKTYGWTCGEASGQATAEDDGVLVIPNLKIAGRLVVTAK